MPSAISSITSLVTCARAASSVAMISHGHMQVALRWRTSDEVVERVGELTCSSLRCEYHVAVRAPSPSPPRHHESRRGHRDVPPSEAPLVKARLTPYQLDFVYEEVRVRHLAGIDPGLTPSTKDGEIKQALVKVVLCDRCGRKLAYPSRKAKEVGREGSAPSRTPQSVSRQGLTASRTRRSASPIMRQGKDGVHKV